MFGKKKRASSHGSDDDDGKWKIFPHFFVVGNDLRDDVLTLLSKPNVLSVVGGPLPQVAITSGFMAQAPDLLVLHDHRI